MALTLVIIKHGGPLVMRISNRIIAMESGRILAEGSPGEVRRDPAVSSRIAAVTPGRSCAPA